MLPTFHSITTLPHNNSLCLGWTSCHSSAWFPLPAKTVLSVWWELTLISPQIPKFFGGLNRCHFLVNCTKWNGMHSLNWIMERNGKAATEESLSKWENLFSFPLSQWPWTLCRLLCWFLLPNPFLQSQCAAVGRQRNTSLIDWQLFAYTVQEKCHIALSGDLKGLAEKQADEGNLSCDSL